MEKERVSWLPLDQNWDPERTAKAIHEEVENRWNEGWVFERSETDGIMESICLYFRWPDESGAPPSAP